MQKRVGDEIDIDDRRAEDDNVTAGTAATPSETENHISADLPALNEEALLTFLTSPQVARAMAGMVVQAFGSAMNDTAERINEHTEEMLARTKQEMTSKLSSQWREIYHEFMLATEARMADMQREMVTVRKILDKGTLLEPKPWWKRLFRSFRKL